MRALQALPAGGIVKLLFSYPTNFTPVLDKATNASLLMPNINIEALEGFGHKF